VLGTPAYMAPEQAAGDTSPDARADVFGLGATLTFLATGRAPDEAGPPPRPAALAAICARATAADPVSRYPRVEDLAADVRRFTEGSRVMAHAERPWERAWRFVLRHRVAFGLVLAYLVVRTVLWLTLRR